MYLLGYVTRLDATCSNIGLSQCRAQCFMLPASMTVALAGGEKQGPKLHALPCAVTILCLEAY